MGKKAQHFWIEPDNLSRKGMDFCSLEAQGLWLKVMCLLHASERYGYLSRDGKPVSDEQAARRCGLDVQKWVSLVSELLEFDLLRRSADRILYSPELVAQAEWRAGDAKRQRDFQKRKREETAKKNEKYNNDNNDEYNADITPDITAISRPNFKSKNTTISSNEENSGGKPPPQTAANSNSQAESDEEYLARKQFEYPELDVQAIYLDFVDKCGSAQYPRLKNTRRQFDKWLEDEDKPISVGTNNGYVNPVTGKSLK